MPNIPKPKPIRRSSYGIISRTNVPYDQPLTPGLRHSRSPAIGFLADAYAETKPNIFDLMCEHPTATPDKLIEMLQAQGTWRGKDGHEPG